MSRLSTIRKKAPFNIRTLTHIINGDAHITKQKEWAETTAQEHVYPKHHAILTTVSYKKPLRFDPC